MSIKNMLSDIKNNKDNNLYIILLCIAAALMVILAIYSVSRKLQTLDKSNTTDQVDQIDRYALSTPDQANQSEKSTPSINTSNLGIKLPELSIIQSDKQRTYNDIVTTIFLVVKKDTTDTVKLEEGELLIEDVQEVLTEYLKNNKYKTLAIGMVDNMFYIQQDTSETIEKEQKVNIVKLNSTFSIDDWFSLTEATYNNTNTQADSLFSYKQNGLDMKQYIYVYTEKEIETKDKLETQSELDIQTD